MSELSIAKVYQQIVSNVSVNPKHSGSQLKSLKVRRKDDEEYRRELDDKLQREIKQMKADLDSSSLQKTLKLRDFYNNLATDSKRTGNKGRDVGATLDKEQPSRLEVPGAENQRERANRLQIQLPEQPSSEQSRSQPAGKGKKSPNSSQASKPKPSQQRQRPAISVVQPQASQKPPPRPEAPGFPDLVLRRDKRLDAILGKFAQLRRAYEEELLLAEMRVRLSSKKLSKIEPVLDLYDSYLSRKDHLPTDNEPSRSDSDPPSKRSSARTRDPPRAPDTPDKPAKVYLPQPVRPATPERGRMQPGPLKSEIRERLEQADREQRAVRRATKPLSERRKSYFDTSFSDDEEFQADLLSGPPPSQNERVSLASDVKRLYASLSLVFASKQLSAAALHDCEVLVDAMLQKREVYPQTVVQLCQRIAPQLARARITLDSDHIDPRGGQALARSIGYERYVREKVGEWLLDIEDLVDQHEDALSQGPAPRTTRLDSPAKLRAQTQAFQNTSEKKSVRIREPPKPAPREPSSRSLREQVEQGRPLQNLRDTDETSFYRDDVSQERNRELKAVAGSRHPNSFYRVLATDSTIEAQPARATPKKSILKRPVSSESRDTSSVQPAGRVHTSLYYLLPQNPAVSPEFTRKRREVQPVAEASMEFAAKLQLARLLTSSLLCLSFEGINAVFVLAFPTLSLVISLELPAAIAAVSTVRLQAVEELENDIVQKHLVVGDAAGWVHLYSLYTFQLLERFSAHTSAVEAVIESAFCRALVTCDSTGVMRVWNVRDRTEVSLSQSFLLSELFAVFARSRGREAAPAEKPGLLFVDETHFAVSHCGDVYLFAARELLLGHTSIECKCYFTAANSGPLAPMATGQALLLHSGQHLFRFSLDSRRLACAHKHPAGQSLQLFAQAGHETAFVTKTADRKRTDLVLVAVNEPGEPEQPQARQVSSLDSATSFEACGREAFLAIETAGAVLSFGLFALKLS